MTIMPFEGLMSESVEDAFGVGIVTEPTHTVEDEAFYVNYILPGYLDEDEQDFGDYAEDMYDPDGYEADRACDRWERHFWGD